MAPIAARGPEALQEGRECCLLVASRAIAGAVNALSALAEVMRGARR
jgi:hypothetical protein